MNVFIFRGSQLNFPFVGRARLIYYAVIRTAAQPGTLIGSAAVVVRTLALEAAAVDPGGTPKIDRDILCRTSTPYLFRTRQLLPLFRGPQLFNFPIIPTNDDSLAEWIPIPIFVSPVNPVFVSPST